MSLLHFTKWFSCTDTLVLRVGSTIKGRYLGPEAKNAVSSIPMPNVFCELLFSSVVMLINGSLVSTQSCPGKSCRDLPRWGDAKPRVSSWRCPGQARGMVTGVGLSQLWLCPVMSCKPPWMGFCSRRAGLCLASGPSLSL